jgi:hypothetical protein
MEILVVSGTKQEAQAYLEATGKKGEFVSNYMQLEDLSFEEIHFLGTYYARGDLLVLRQFVFPNNIMRDNLVKRKKALTRFIARTSLFQLDEFMRLFPDLYTGDYINIHPWDITQKQRDTMRFIKPKIFRRTDSFDWMKNVLPSKHHVKREMSYA